MEHLLFLIYNFYYIILQVIEFNDVNDTGILTPSSPRISYDTRGFSWTMLDEFKGDSDGKFVSLSMTASDYSGSQDFVSGNITIHVIFLKSTNNLYVSLYEC